MNRGHDDLVGVRARVRACMRGCVLAHSERAPVGGCVCAHRERAWVRGCNLECERERENE